MEKHFMGATIFFLKKRINIFICIFNGFTTIISSTSTQTEVVATHVFNDYYDTSNHRKVNILKKKFSAFHWEIRIEKITKHSVKVNKKWIL